MLKISVSARRKYSHLHYNDRAVNFLKEVKFLFCEFCVARKYNLWGTKHVEFLTLSQRVSAGAMQLVLYVLRTPQFLCSAHLAFTQLNVVRLHISEGPTTSVTGPYSRLST